MAFPQATRLNSRPLARQNYVAGSSTTQQLQQVGYLAFIDVIFTGNLNVVPGTGTAVLSKFAPWNIIRRLSYEIGSGTMLYQTDGYGAYLVNLRNKLGYDPKNGSLSGSEVSFGGQVFSASANAGNNAIKFGLTIPIMINERDDIGLVLLQAQGTITQVLIDWQNAFGSTHDFPVVTTGNASATLTGTVDFYTRTFSVPGAMSDQARIDKVFRTTQRFDTIWSTGENTIRLVEDDVYLRLISLTRVNGLPDANAIRELALRYNITDMPIRLDRQYLYYLERLAYTRDMPDGVSVMDFTNNGYPNYGGDRDWINAQGLAEFELVFNIDPSVTLGSNNNSIATIQQQLVSLAAPVSAVR